MGNRLTTLASRPVVTLGGIGILALAIVAAPMLTGAPRSALAADTGTGTGEHVITVNGTGKVTIKPDVADISLGVQAQAETAKAARDQAAAAMTSVIAAIKNLGITDDNIQTTTLNLSPIYDYNSSTQRITGYQVENSVSVHVTDITKVADVIDDSVAAGATSVDSVSFDVSDRTDAENQARTAAVMDARSHADAYAAAAGVTITGVQMITETSYTSPLPYFGTADASKGAVAGAPAVPTPIQPGSQDITISVTVSYLI